MSLNASTYRQWRIFLYAILTSQHHRSRSFQQVDMCKSCSYEDLIRTNNSVEYKETSSSSEEGEFLRRLLRSSESSKTSGFMHLEPSPTLRYPIHSCNSSNLRIIVKLLLIPLVFSNQGFSRKILSVSVSLSLCCVLFMCNTPSYIYRLW